MNFIKKILHSFQQTLFYSIVFLIPTQIAYHIWPKYSFVYGLKIDYLSAAIYLTDILIVIYVFISFFTNKRSILFKKGNLLNVLIFLLFIAINIFYSSQRELSILKWIKILELLAFAFFVSKDRFIKSDFIYRIFCFSIIFFGTIGLAQVIKGSTLGGIFYYFGERSFTSLTPGISLINIFNLSLLRPYSTFSHPNSFAGYLLIVLVLLIFWKTNNKDKYLKYLTFIIICVLLIFIFSKAVLFSFFVVSMLLFLNVFKNVQTIKYLPFLIIIISVLSPVFSVFLLKYRNAFPDNVTERLLLSEMSGQILKTNSMFGIGLNNFISYMPTLSKLRMPFWLLQPVHNIFLLFSVETGLIGITFLFINFFKYFKYLIDNNKTCFIIVFIAICLSGIFDPYWFTLQQNLIIIFLFLGLSKNKQFK